MTTIKLSDVKAILRTIERVENMKSTRGNLVPNQFLLTCENGEVFQSYNTFIGAKINGKLYLTSSHAYSVTTSKYCGLWCGMNTAERRKGIANGSIIFIKD